MSHPSAALPGDQHGPPSYPSMQELRDAERPVQTLPGRLGLIWQLNGPLDSAAILIKEGPNTPEPYYDTTTGKWHQFSTSTLTEPKISTITVTVDELLLWEESWLEEHIEHSDPDDQDLGPDIEWKIISDWDLDMDEEEIQLVKCCGEIRPRIQNASLTVIPANDGQGFVTLHDYLSTVHPWLMGLRDDLKAALTMLYGTPLEDGAQLSVNSTGLDTVMIEKELNMFLVQSGASIPVVQAETRPRKTMTDWPPPYDVETMARAGIPSWAIERVDLPEGS